MLVGLMTGGTRGASVQRSFARYWRLQTIEKKIPVVIIIIITRSGLGSSLAVKSDDWGAAAGGGRAENF